MIEWDNTAQAYFTQNKDKEQQVDNMLNNEVRQQQEDFTRVWTNDLVLVDEFVNVIFGQPANVTVVVGSGLLMSEVIKEAALQSSVLNDYKSFVFVKQGSCVEIDLNSQV